MKRTIFTLSAALFIIAAQQTSFAQDINGTATEPETQQPQFNRNGGRGRQQMDPEVLAKRTVDRLNKVVGLTDKQYKKLYKFHLGLIEEQMEENSFGGGYGMGGYGGYGGYGRGGQRPDGWQRPDGGQRPDGAPDARPQRPQRPDGAPSARQDSTRRQRPQMTEEQRAEWQARRQAMMEERKAIEEERKAAEAERQALIEKKYKKVLTPAQLEALEKFKADEAARREAAREKFESQRRNGRGHGNGHGPRNHQPQPVKDSAQTVTTPIE